MFKVNNKDSRTTPMAYFTPCSSVSIVNFEHVIDGWVGLKSVFLVPMKCITEFTTAPKRMFTLLFYFENCLNFIILLTLHNRVQFSKCSRIST